MRSRLLSLRISGYDPSKMVAIRQIANENLPWDWCNTEPSEDMYGDVHLCIITGVGSFLLSLSLDIWLVNGSYCTVTVSSTGPDGDVEHELSEEDFYARLIRKTE